MDYPLLWGKPELQLERKPSRQFSCIWENGRVSLHVAVCSIHGICTGGRLLLQVLVSPFRLLRYLTSPNILNSPLRNNGNTRYVLFYS